MTLLIGTSGWAYKEWKPDFYPQDLPQRRFLEHYSRTLTACEINATFYRMQSESTFDRWAEETPASFRFSTKAHRALTHGRGMAPDEDRRAFIRSYLASVGRLGPKLGVVLWQFPPHRKRDDAALDAILEAIAGPQRFAIEFRDDSWTDPGVREAIAAAGGTVCISETAGEVPDALPPGPLAYVRLRAERYSDQSRAGWKSLLTNTARDRDVYAFTKHEGIPANDRFGGVGLAQWLCREVADGG